MAIGATVDFRVKPERFEEFKEFMAKTLVDTRAFDGCRSVQTLIDQDEPGRMLLVEEWDSREQQEKYIAWRMENGLMQALEPYITAPPAMALYDQTNI